MKVSFFYMVMVIGSSQLLVAYSTFGQTPEQRMTKIEMLNEDFNALFTKLKIQAGLSFLFSGKAEGHGNIYLPMAERTVKEVLDSVLAKRGLTYYIKGNTVFIHESVNPEGRAKYDPAYTIVGVVVNMLTQEPIPGVNVLVKGTTRGTSSNSDGKFVISVEKNNILIFSFIGFKTIEMQVGERTTFTIEMEEDIAKLDEVVVSTGYWDIGKKLNPGNISKVTSEEISKQPVINPLQALQGRVPGVDIQQLNGLPGGRISIQIRGRTNINVSGGVSQPLYVVDGVPFSSDDLGIGFGGILGSVSPLNSINPADIESVEILKDADATAIYGSRGANGVVLIKTKGVNQREHRLTLIIQRDFRKLAIEWIC